MGLKALKSRIERLERRMNGGECEGCNQIGIKRFLLNVERHSEGKPEIEDWSKTDFARCPDCGNPNPKRPSWRYWTKIFKPFSEDLDRKEANEREQMASEIDRDVK